MSEYKCPYCGVAVLANVIKNIPVAKGFCSYCGAEGPLLETDDGNEAMKCFAEGGTVNKVSMRRWERDSNPPDGWFWFLFPEKEAQIAKLDAQMRRRFENSSTCRLVGPIPEPEPEITKAIRAGNFVV